MVKNNLNPVFNDEFSFVVGAKEQKINLNGKAFENWELMKSCLDLADWCDEEINSFPSLGQRPGKRWPSGRGAPLITSCGLEDPIETSEKYPKVQVPLWSRVGILEGIVETQELLPMTNDGTSKNKVITTSGFPRHIHQHCQHNLVYCSCIQGH